MDIIMKKLLMDRYIILSIFIFVFGIMLIVRLFDLQIVNGEANFEKSMLKRTTKRTIPAARGNIYDRNGIPIASNRLGFGIHYVYTKMPVNERNDMLLKLAQIFEANNDNYCPSLLKYISIKDGQLGYGYAVQELQSIINTIKIQKDKAFSKEDEESIHTLTDAFNYLRSEFKIDEGYSLEEAYKIMRMRFEMWPAPCSLLNPLEVASDVSETTVAQIEEQNSFFPGVTTYTKPLRQYQDAEYIAHILGYIREISAEELEKWKDKGYKNKDLVGKAGIELYAEDKLRGTEGYEYVEVDIKGKQTGVVEATPSKPGNDLYLTIDMNLQKVAFNSMEKYIDVIRNMGGIKNYGDAFAGSVVAIDVKNGDVLALVSYPTYDPNIFLNNDNEAITHALNDVKNKPTLNRAIQSHYAPGSTYKPLVSIAALEEHIITEKTEYQCKGTDIIAYQKFGCLEGSQGWLALEKALATSCNLYYAQVGVSTGIDNIVKWAKQFGLGQKTGIELYGEQKGIIASKEYKSLVEKDTWWPANTAQAAIGQSYNVFTPLQLANYIATLANGGTRYSPHIIKKFVSSDGSNIEETPVEAFETGVSAQTINSVKKGMLGVVGSSEGTAFKVFKDFPFTVAGKTGTAETGREINSSSNGLFICYAPAEDPQIAVALIIEHGVYGSYTAPVAKDILKEYFQLSDLEDTDYRILYDEYQLVR